MPYSVSSPKTRLIRSLLSSSCYKTLELYGKLTASPIREFVNEIQTIWPVVRGVQTRVALDYPSHKTIYSTDARRNAAGDRNIRAAIPMIVDQAAFAMSA